MKEKELLLQDYVECFLQVSRKVENFNFLYQDTCTAAGSYNSAQHRLYSIISHLVYEGLLDEQAKHTLRGSALCPTAEILFFTFPPERFEEISTLLRSIHYDASAKIVLDFHNISSYLVSPNIMERECATRLYSWLHEEQEFA